MAEASKMRNAFASKPRYLVEFDVKAGEVLIIGSYIKYEPAKIWAVRRLMKARRIRRAIVCDVIEGDSEEFEDLILQCSSHEAVLLIPRISPILEIPSNYEPFLFSLIRSGVLFFAFDRPELTQDSLIIEMTRMEVFPASKLDWAVKNAKRLKSTSTKSIRIKSGLAEAKARGVKLGNPRLAVAQAKARAACQAVKPSPETLSLMIAWRQEGKTFREIARVLNERKIRPPHARQWSATTVRNQIRHLVT